MSGAAYSTADRPLPHEITHVSNTGGIPSETGVFALRCPPEAKNPSWNARSRHRNSGFGLRLTGCARQQTEFNWSFQHSWKGRWDGRSTSVGSRVEGQAGITGTTWGSPT
jgi:hypothetical protein